MSASKYFSVYFAPDADPSWGTNPGVLVDVGNAVPTKRNTLTPYYGQFLAGAAVFNSNTHGLPKYGVIRKTVNGIGYLFLGTANKLMRYNASDDLPGWSTPGSIALNPTTTWDFTTYGNHLIACGGTGNIPIYDDAYNPGGFKALGDALAANCCTTQKNFILMGAINTGSEVLGDQISWSALGNDLDWTPDAATEAGNYRVVETPGPIKSLVNIRDAVVAYKDDSLYLGEYQGSPLLWTWRLISDHIGCAALHGVAVAQGAHWFLHRTGIYRFDGSSVQLVSAAAVRFIQNKITTHHNFDTMQAAVDEYEGNIYWFVHDEGATFTELRYALVYNYYTNQLGFVNQSLAGGGYCYCVINGNAGDVAGLGDSPPFSQPSQQCSVILAGSQSAGSPSITMRVPIFGNQDSNAAMSFTTGDIGDEDKTTLVTRVKPRFLNIRQPGTWGALTNGTVKTKMFEGGAYDAGTAYIVDPTRQRYDGTRQARWLNFSATISAAELAGLQVFASSNVSSE